MNCVINERIGARGLNFVHCVILFTFVSVTTDSAGISWFKSCMQCRDQVGFILNLYHYAACSLKQQSCKLSGSLWFVWAFDRWNTRTLLDGVFIAFNCADHVKEKKWFHSPPHLLPPNKVWTEYLYESGLDAQDFRWPSKTLIHSQINHTIMFHKVQMKICLFWL